MAEKVQAAVRTGPSKTEFREFPNFPLEKVTTHTFGLKDVDLAIRSVRGQGVPDVIHASLLPWQ